MTTHEHDIDLRTIGQRLVRNWWIVAGVMAVLIIIGVVRSGSTATSYTATATVYLGQPVSPSGNLLPTITSNATTALNLATGDESIAAAADAAGTDASRIRHGLSVTSIQSPIASKLTTPPVLIKVAATDRSATVANASTMAVANHVIDATSTYARTKKRELKREIAHMDQSVADLEQQQSSAVRAAAGARGTEQTSWSVLLGIISRDLADARRQQSETRAQISLTDELETPRVLESAHAVKNVTAARGPRITMSALLGLIIGCAVALVVRRPRTDTDA